MTKKQIFIRVDISPEIGAGHFMRMIALGEMFLVHEYVVHFFCFSKGVKDVKSKLPDAFIYYSLETNSQEDDLLFLQSKAKEMLPKLIVFDGDAFTQAYDVAFKQPKTKVLIVNDIPTRKYMSDFVLNQNHGAESFNYQYGENTKLLSGLKYLLLRDEFKTHHPRKKELDKSNELKVLVSLGGGSKATNTILEKICEAFTSLEHKISSLTVLVGKMGEVTHTMEKHAKSSPFEVIFRTHTDDMVKEIISSDFAITSGGYTMWELFYLKTPFMALALNSRQAKYLSFLKQEKLCEYITSEDLNEQQKLIQKMINFIQDDKRHQFFLMESEKIFQQSRNRRSQLLTDLQL